MAQSEKQFNISLSPELKKRLTDLAIEFEMEKATKVGADIIKTFVDHWARLQILRREAKQRVDSEIMQSLERPPLLKGEAQINPTAGRKRRKR